MKQPSDKPQKPHKFLKMPSFPGGKSSFREFVKENLRYPEEALKNSIQGTVFLDYTVDNIGTVENIVVTRGIGYGCDEEAIRLIKLITYPAVKNKGVKMKVSMKTRISFVLPAPPKEKKEITSEIRINYTAASQPAGNKPEQPPQPSYGYTLTFGSKPHNS